MVSSVDKIEVEVEKGIFLRGMHLLMLVLLYGTYRLTIIKYYAK